GGELADTGLRGVAPPLDGEGHAGLQRQPARRLAVVQDLGLLVELAADAVAAELAYHREAVLLRVRLDDGADVAEARAGPHLPDAEPHAFESHVDQPPRLDVGLADVEHAAAISVVAVLDDGDVDVEDVGQLEDAFAGNAMADLVVHRGADRLGIGLVARRRV